jgi:hypothetical protein
LTLSDPSVRGTEAPPDSAVPGGTDDGLVSADAPAVARVPGPDERPAGKSLRLGLRRLIRGHRLFTGLLLLGVLLRVCAMLAFRPALWFNDAFEYVSVALHPAPYAIRPNGYSWFLRLLEPAHSIVLVVLVQHLMGLATGVLLYGLTRRLGLPAWAGCVAALPVLLDSLEEIVEHTLLSDTLFTLLLVAATALAVGRRRISSLAPLAVGLLLAAAMLTRPAALPVILAFGVWLLLRRVGWRPLVTFIAGVVLPLAAYAGWYDSVHGAFALTSSTGIQLYGRVGGFADCQQMHPGPDLAVLCPPPSVHGEPAPTFVWDPSSPLASLPGYEFTPAKEKLARSFAEHAILAQPGDYLHVVARDVWRASSWRPGPYPDAFTSKAYLFSDKPWPVTDQSLDIGGTQASVASAYGHGDPRTRVVRPYATVLIASQHWFRLPGTVLMLSFLVALTGLGPKSAHGERVSRSTLALVLATGLALAFGPILTVQLDYRYLLPSMGFAAMSAMLALARWQDRRSRRAADGPGTHRFGKRRASSGLETPEPVRR